MKEKFTGKESTFWLENCPGTKFPKLKEGLNVDVAVLGGGIVGVTTATLLKESGFKVALIEANRIVKDVSVGTTAKISAAPNIIYHRLISNLGRDKAQKFADASMKSLEKISEIVKERNIDCNFHRLPLYIYSESYGKMDEIKDECKAAKELGLPVSYNENVPLPFKTGPAIKYDNQAQFHPRKYLLALSEDLDGDGSYIFEQTCVITVKEGIKKEIITDKGSITADKVIIATHMPVYDPDSIKKHMHPARSYVLALYSNEDFPDGMFIDIDPMHTYRTTPTKEGKLIIVAGEHSAIDVEDKNIYYKLLEDYARKHIAVKSVAYRWSSIDAATDDGVPIIGKTSKEGIYISTGFGFWGMINGTTAAMVNADIINQKDNKFADLFDPLRFND
ncbi:MAG: NAD(P)/FAD-dependent oxidoreductase [Methanobacterium sp.]